MSLFPASLTGLLTFLALSIHQSACSQQISRPYSVYGIGDRETGVNNKLSGMAGAGLAISSGKFVISQNPASLAGLEKSYYSIDAGFTGKAISFSGEAITADNKRQNDFSLDRFAFSTKINSFWASSLGFQRFSSVGYGFTGTKQVEGSTETSLASYQGDGGLNDFFWSNAVSVGKKLALGVKASVLTGSINQGELLTDAGGTYFIESRVQNNYSSLRLEYGFLYRLLQQGNWAWSIGGKYAAKTSLPARQTLSVTENNRVIIEDAYQKTERFSLPASISTGIAAQNKKGLILAADYTHEGWNSLKQGGNGWQLKNSDRLALGIEWKRHTNYWKEKLERNFGQVGLFAQKEYLNIRNEQLNRYGLTAGIGGLLRQNLLYTLSAEVGVRGNTTKGLIRENYAQLSVTLSYRDFFFSGGRKYN